MCLLKNVFDAVSKDKSGTIGRVYVKYRSGECHWYRSVSTFLGLLLMLFLMVSVRRMHNLQSYVYLCYCDGRMNR